MKTETTSEKKLKVLLSDYGYSVIDDILIDNGVRGFIPRSIVGKFKSILAMAEHLIPVISDNNFWERYNRIVIY